MTGTVRDLTFDAGGRAILSLNISGDIREEIDRLNGKTLDISLKEHKPKRSGEANRYMWSLCEAIAVSQGISKEEVYRKCVREVGVYVPMTLTASAYDRFAEEWERRGLAWFVDVVDTSRIGEVEVFAYYGSSTYNTAEMSRLIKAVTEDARALGIPTETPAELALLLKN